MPGKATGKLNRPSSQSWKASVQRWTVASVNSDSSNPRISSNAICAKTHPPLQHLLERIDAFELIVCLALNVTLLTRWASLVLTHRKRELLGTNLALDTSFARPLVTRALCNVCHARDDYIDG